MIKLNEVKAHLYLDKGKRIGAEGKNSDVWIARDKQLEQMLVLKEINKESLDRHNIENYFLEAQILNENRHPHIMPVYYSAEDDDNIYITMPYYNKGSLNNLIDEKMLTVREIIKYSLDFLSGLLHIHIKEILHLDIKPTNIMINDNDRAVLTDFGLSQYLNEHGFADQPIQYNSHRSPESYISNDKTHLDDIYQVGMTMYRLCNGNTDFKEQYDILRRKCGNDKDMIIQVIQNEEFPNREEYLPHIPTQLRTMINKMLNVDYSKRYKDILTIINDLSKIEKMLDWEYYSIIEKEEMNWIWKTDTAIVTVSLKKIEDDYFTFGEKSIISSGNTINQNKYKRSHTSLEDALKFLKDVLPD